MKKLVLICLLFPFISRAQEDAGVFFQDGSSWAAVQAKAKAEHKYIFIDCYTTWCGPCKYMKTKIFPTAEAGAFFNAQFVSVGVQLDSTKKDNDTIRSWYADAHAIGEKYHVRAYPTFLILSPDGKPLTRIVGGNEKAGEFIGRVKEMMLPEKQYYTLLQRYEKGQRDTAFLYKMAMASLDAYDMTTTALVANDYLAAQKDLFTKENLQFINLTMQSSRDKGFSALLHNPKKADAILGEGKAQQKVMGIILKEEIYPVMHGQGKTDWTVIQKRVTAKYPKLADEVLLKGKVIYYQNKNDWPNFQQQVVAYMKKYGQHASLEEMNDFAFTVFQHCEDMSCVSEALDWSRRSIKDNPNAAFYDTYANILYKMGKKDEAITWEQKGLDLAEQGEKTTYQQTLDKMKKGEKTWD
jgi:thiol-disulfide isomerase/thioredoxin